MTPTATDRLKGTLDLLILRTLNGGAMHGWAIAQIIQERSSNSLLINQGSLYPALHRLEERGWIAAEWGASDNNRRARYYCLTPAGDEQLNRETATWEEFVRAVTGVLRPASEGQT